MKENNSTTKDLAKEVFKKIKGAKVASPLPNEEILNKLFENLFYASIKTEESDFIKVTVSLINSKNPDPKPPSRIVKNRWSYTRFEEPIPFTVKNITKLSKAADPWSSSLAVDFDKDELFIWGLIDQSVHYQSFLHYEASSGPEQPGIFQTSVTGIGNLVVIIDYELIATLKQNVLISNYLDVFRLGNVFEILQSHMAGYKTEIQDFINEEFPEEDFDFWEKNVETVWTQTLSRILLRIQNYHHGGAILISNSIDKDLDIKHKIDYIRLKTSMSNLTKFNIENYAIGNIIYEQFLEDGVEEALPMDLYLIESTSEIHKTETTDELKGAIRFVASLSCIDGLVVCNEELEVKGFGAVIKNIKLPDYIYLSKTSRINTTKLVAISPNHFGTRHRSMFSYCWKYEGSIGFVVSQDGDIRAITRIDDRLIMWENIKVQQMSRSRKLKRLIPTLSSLGKK